MYNITIDLRLPYFLFFLCALKVFLATSLLHSSPPSPHTHSDYGFKPADGFNGPCVRDEAVPVDDPCADGQVKTVMKSRGYRKVAGDVCIKGSRPDFEYYEFTCCINDNSKMKLKTIIIGISVALGGTLLLLIIIIVVVCLAW